MAPGRLIRPVIPDLGLNSVHLENFDRRSGVRLDIVD
jgi:hypothetical protein